MGEVLGGRHIPGLAVVPLDVRGDERSPSGSWELHGREQAVGIDVNAGGGRSELGAHLALGPLRHTNCQLSPESRDHQD